MATKNQLLTQLDRAFRGLSLTLADVLGTKVGPAGRCALR